MSWEKLFVGLWAVDYSVLMLAIGLQVHAGPRVIRTSAGCLPSGVVITTSTVAGDGQSNSLARGLLHQTLELAHRAHRPVATREFVDDLAQRDECVDGEAVVYRISGAAASLARALLALKLRPSVGASGKSAVVASKR